MDTDAALVVQIGSGDRSALARLVERHKRFAYRVALGLVGNRDDAFDISQEAFLRVHRSARTFKEGQPFQPWFYTIIANLSRTWLRRRQRRDYPKVELDKASHLLIDNSNPEAATIKREEVERLRAALEKLSFADREIVTLQHFRAYSYEEIANLLDIPKGTVMSRLYYARKRLAALMKEDYE